jgi:hypothetical protein
MIKVIILHVVITLKLNLKQIHHPIVALCGKGMKTWNDNQAHMCIDSLLTGDSLTKWRFFAHVYCIGRRCAGREP